MIHILRPYSFADFVENVEKLYLKIFKYMFYLNTILMLVYVNSRYCVTVKHQLRLQKMMCFLQTSTEKHALELSL